MRSGAQTPKPQMQSGKPFHGNPALPLAYIETILAQTKEELPKLKIETAALLKNVHSVNEAADLLNRVSETQAALANVGLFLQQEQDTPKNKSEAFWKLGHITEAYDTLNDQAETLSEKLGEDIDQENFHEIRKKHFIQKSLYLAIGSATAGTLASDILWGAQALHQPELVAGCVAVSLTWGFRREIGMSLKKAASEVCRVARKVFKPLFAFQRQKGFSPSAVLGASAASRPTQAIDGKMAVLAKPAPALT